MAAAALAACGRASPPPVALGDAARFAVLAAASITWTGDSVIGGDVGVGAPATSLAGLALVPDASGTFSTAPGVSGRVYAVDDAPPTPTTLMSATDDMQRAFADAAGRLPDIDDLDGGTLLKRTLVTAVYCWSGSVTIPLDVKLDGSATDVWIFQIAGDLKVAAGVAVHMIGDPPLPRNVFWQVSGDVSLGPGAHLEGVLLGPGAIAMASGASLNGRLLSQGAIALDGATIAEPSP
jgi:hypothetical protein